jgi:hypothetical protein
MPRWRRQRIKKVRKQYEQETANNIVALRHKIEAGKATAFDEMLLERLQSPHFAHVFQRARIETAAFDKRARKATLEKLVEVGR